MAAPERYVEYRERVARGETFRAGNIIKRNYIAINGTAPDGFFIIELFTEADEAFYMFLVGGDRIITNDIDMRTIFDSVTFA